MSQGRYQRENHHQYKSAAYRLWHFRYPVKMQDIFRFGQPYLDKAGYIVSGDDDLDTKRRTAITVCQRTPIQMATLYSEGAEIEPATLDDIPIIYGDLVDHLHDWRFASSSGVYVNDQVLQVLEDLRLFENFAQYLHTVAQRYQQRKRSRNAIFDRLIAFNQRRLGGDPTPRRGTPNIRAYQPILPTIERNLLETEHGD